MADSENHNAAMNRSSRGNQRECLKMRGEKRHHHRSVESSCSSKSSKSTSSVSNEPERDQTILNRRQNQIDLMKNTTAYDNYTQKVPKESRAFYQPRTPNKYKQYSRRQWDGLIKAWKLQIHAWNAEGSSSPEKDATFPVVEDWKNDGKDELEEETEKEDEEASENKYRKRAERSFDYSWCEVLDESD